MQHTPKHIQTYPNQLLQGCLSTISHSQFQAVSWCGSQVLGDRWWPQVPGSDWATTGTTNYNYCNIGRRPKWNDANGMIEKCLVCPYSAEVSGLVLIEHQESWEALSGELPASQICTSKAWLRPLRSCQYGEQEPQESRNKSLIPKLVIWLSAWGQGSLDYLVHESNQIIYPGSRTSTTIEHFSNEFWTQFDGLLATLCCWQLHCRPRKQDVHSSWYLGEIWDWLNLFTWPSKFGTSVSSCKRSNLAAFLTMSSKLRFTSASHLCFPKPMTVALKSNISA